MAAKFGDFMLGLEVMIGQAALFGMFALWLASRRSRLARVIGGLFVILTVWTSFVPIIDRLGGYPARSDADSCVLTIVALTVGWIAGRNRRLRTLASQPTNSGRPRLIFDGPVRSIGSWIVGLSQLYGVLAGLFGFLVVLSIVSDVAGFWGLVVGFSIAPATFTIAPLYAGFRWHNWMPAALCYGALVTMFLGFTFGKLVAEKPWDD